MSVVFNRDMGVSMRQSIFDMQRPDRSAIGRNRDMGVSMRQSIFNMQRPDRSAIAKPDKCMHILIFKACAFQIAKKTHVHFFQLFFYYFDKRIKKTGLMKVPFFRTVSFTTWHLRTIT